MDEDWHETLHFVGLLVLMTLKTLTFLDRHLYGLDDSYLNPVSSLKCTVHGDVVEPLLTLVAQARAAGFGMRVASSYRSFERQLAIWNAKASGQRLLLDSDGQPLDSKSLGERELLFAILRWSALPGASRHHWGTDIDVYDAAAIAPGYELQLTVAETCGEGPFAPFHCWLTDTLASDHNLHFYRPYARDTGGVAPEPWHLSYAPVAKVFAEAFSERQLGECIEASDILLKPTILENLPEIYQRFVQLD